MYQHSNNKDFKLNNDKSDSEITGHINKLYEESLSKVRGHHYSWLLQISYIAGDQYKTLDSKTYKIRESQKVYDHEEREVFNKMRTPRNYYLSRITMNKPIPWATPRTMKEKDKKIAKVTNAVLHDTWEKLEMDSQYDMAGQFLVDYGSCFLKTIWDKNLGKKIISNLDRLEEDIDKSNFLDPDYKRQLKRSIVIKKDLFEGDINSSILSPFEIYVDNPTRRNLEECPWVMHVRSFPIEQLKRTYVLTDEEIKPEKVNSVTLQGGSMTYGIGYSSQNYGYKTNQLEDVALVKEYYERPTNEFPNGRFIITVGDTVVYYGDLPYKNGRDGKRDFPFIRMTATPETGNFYGATPIADIRGVQRRYNAVRNRTAEALNRKAVGQWIAYEDSLHRQTRLTNKPGNVIIVKKNRPAPAKVQDSANTNDFRAEAADLTQDFTQITGVNTLEQGMSSAMRSATQMSMYTEAEDNRIALTTKSMAKAIQKWAKQVIRLYQQFTIGKRFVQLNDGWEDGIDWSADMVDDNIYIKNISSLAVQPSQKTQMIFDLTNLGLFHEQNPYGITGTMNLLEALDLNYMDLDHLVPFRTDLDKATRENRRVMNGEKIVVDPLDNHSIHLKEHRELLMSEEWEDFIRKIGTEGRMDIAKQLEAMFREHIQLHSKEVQLAQMRQNAALAQQQEG